MERTPWPMEAAIALIFLLAMIWAAQHVNDPRPGPPIQSPTTARAPQPALPK